MADAKQVNKKNLYLFQPQYTSIFSGKRQAWIPYSVGVLWAYALQFPEITDHWKLKDIIFLRENVELLINRLESPALCAFSVYIWNNQYCLEVAKKIKQQWPNCQIVFGGPQVSGMYSRYKFIDCIVLNEGEQCFLKILETINQGRDLETYYKLPRMDSIEYIPSPFSVGIFDDLITNNPDLYWSAPIETNRGCPYACTFCDWGGLTLSKIKKFSLERVIADMDWITQRPFKTIIITDANFGIFVNRDLEIAKIIKKFVDQRPGIEYINVTYAKMSNERIFEIAAALGTAGRGITFSVQSMNPDVLEEIKRKNMKSSNIQNLIELADQHKLNHYTELILGLPKETLHSWKQGISDLLELGQHTRIDVSLAMVLENTELLDSQAKKFNIKLIYAKEMIPYYDPEENFIPEIAPIVKSTSTMTTEDMVEAYMFFWIVNYWDLNNNSRLLAAFCRNRLDISYLTFYETLQSTVKNNLGPVGETYRLHQNALIKMFQIGESGVPGLTFDSLQTIALKFFYENIESAVNLGISTAKSFGSIDPGIIDLQKRVINNQIWTVPHTVCTATDLATWELKPCTYLIESKDNVKLLQNEDFFVHFRRTRSLENSIKKLIKDI